MTGIKTETTTVAQTATVNPSPTSCYGNLEVPKMYAEVQTLREAIRAEGTPEIQDAWDQVEQHIDFAYQKIHRTG